MKVQMRTVDIYFKCKVFILNNVNKECKQTNTAFTEVNIILVRGRPENLGSATILPREGAAEIWRSRFFYHEPSDEDSA